MPAARERDWALVPIRDFPDAAAQAFDAPEELRVVDGPSDTVVFRRTSDRRRRSASVHAVALTLADLAKPNKR
jgi:hypothetical protein